MNYLSMGVQLFFSLKVKINIRFPTVSMLDDIHVRSYSVSLNIVSYFQDLPSVKVSSWLNQGWDDLDNKAW